MTLPSMAPNHDRAVIDGAAKTGDLAPVPAPSSPYDVRAGNLSRRLKQAGIAR